MLTRQLRPLAPIHGRSGRLALFVQPVLPAASAATPAPELALFCQGSLPVQFTITHFAQTAYLYWRPGGIGFVCTTGPASAGCQPRLGSRAATLHSIRNPQFICPVSSRLFLPLSNRKSSIINHKSEGVPLPWGRVAGIHAKKWVASSPEISVSACSDTGKENLSAGRFQVLDCCTNKNTRGVSEGLELPPDSGHTPSPHSAPRRGCVWGAIGPAFARRGRRRWGIQACRSISI